MVAFTVRLNEEVDEKLELAAFLEDRSKSEIIREALATYLDKYNGTQDPRK